MNTQNRTFELSLECFQKPATLISIAILLLNDHVLKILCPSWLTGKLSDFAGLFFFPFLVAATIGIILRKSKIDTRKVGAIAFVFVGALFSLLKISPDFNLLFGQIASNLLGHPVRYALDPTDLAALIVLLPAWRMWSETRESHPRQLAWIALSIASLASLATSPAPPAIEQVVDFVYYNDVLYATDTTQSPQLFAATKDAGLSWDDLYFVYGENGYATLEDLAPLVKPQKFPIVCCDPNDTKTCYRINFGNRVEVSKDAGGTWETAWQIPESRYYFVQRNGGADINTYDMVLLNQNNKSVLLVALGSEGVLRHEMPNGEWQRLMVGRAYPTPYQENNFNDALSFVKTEHVLWLGLALLYFALTMRWHLVRTGIDNPAIRGYLTAFVFPVAYFLSAWLFYAIVSGLGNAVAGQPSWSFSFFLFLYLPFFVEAIASVQANTRSIVAGILSPGLIYVLGYGGFIVIMLILVQIISFFIPLGSDVPNIVSRLMEYIVTYFGGYILPILVCVAIFWFGLRKNIKFISEKGLWKIFLIHLAVSIFIAVGSLFFPLWALGKIPWYGIAWLSAGLSLVILASIGVVVSRLSKRKTSTSGPLEGLEKEGL